MVDCSTSSPTTCIFFIAYLSSIMRMQKSSNLHPIEEDREDETWIDGVSLMLLHNQDEDGEGYDEEDE